MLTSKKRFLTKIFLTLIFIIIMAIAGNKITLNNSNYNEQEPNQIDKGKKQDKIPSKEQNKINDNPQDSINENLKTELNSYLADIKGYTGFEVDHTQKSHIISYINSNPVYNLPSPVTAEHRKDFDSKRKGLILLWEKHYNRKWPKYTEDIKENGKIVRYKGQNYDAHHIIELSWNGPNEWWNLTPAMYPSQHQNGIHSKGSISSKLFSKE